MRRMAELQKKREKKARTRRYLAKVKRMAFQNFGAWRGHSHYATFKLMREERKASKSPERLAAFRAAHSVRERAGLL